jgi:hypothetical protein
MTLPPAPNLVGEPLTLKELTILLIQHYGKTEGKFELQLEFQIGAGSFGPDPSKQVPSVIAGVSKVALVESKGDGPLVVDAASVNRKRPPRKSART